MASSQGSANTKSKLDHVGGVLGRPRPVLTNALMADYPSDEQAVLFAVARSARIWEDLDRLVYRASGAC